MKKIYFYILIGIIFCVVNVTTYASDKINSSPEKFISLNFHNISVNDLLGVLAESAKQNIIVSDKVKGNITISLSKITWREALEIILKMQNLKADESNNVLYVMPLSEISSSKEPQFMEEKFLKIHYAHAESLVEVLTKNRNLLSPTGSVIADQRTNSLLVKDSPEKLKTIINYLREIDIPIRQVLIEARIIYADENFVRELGLKFGTSKTKSLHGAQGLNMDLPIEKISDPGLVTFAVAKLGSNTLLDLELAALENEGRGKVLSNPKLVTANRESAYIEAGDEVPYQEKTSSGATSVMFKKAVLGLKVTPEITPGNQINLALQLNQDKVNKSQVNGEPTIQTRQIQTKVLVNNGQTIVLGGIYEESKYHVAMRIPFLSAIPFFGSLFQNQQTLTEHKELLIFVTPKVIPS
jgi:type IV pilus assembly protein PilQ